MSEQGLKIERKGSVAYLQLNRPEVRNAFNAELIQEITDSLRDLSKDKELRALVLSGGGKHFCAGADLNWMRSTIDYTEEENEKDSSRLHAMLETLYRFPRPTIVRVHGAAFGGAVGLISAGDIAVGASNAIFSLSEVRLGIVPAVISPFVMRKIGMGGFRAFGLSAKRFSADEALRIGLLQEVVSPEDLDDSVDRWVHLVLENGPEAMAKLKTLSEQVFGSVDLETASSHTIQTNAKARTSKEGQEGMRAFLDKRAPGWKVKKG